MHSKPHVLTPSQLSAPPHPLPSQNNLISHWYKLHIHMTNSSNVIGRHWAAVITRGEPMTFTSLASSHHLNRCALTSLTASGRLLLFTAPHSQGKVWRHILTLTNTLLDAEIVSTLTQQNKALFSVCTAFSWLPSLLNDGGCGLLAMATRSGHLVLVEVPLPIGESRFVDFSLNCHFVIDCVVQWRWEGSVGGCYSQL